MYQNEADFLAHYDPDAFERVAVTTDVLVFSVAEEPSFNYRKTAQKKFTLLLVERDDFPQKGKWSLPGGFLGSKEELTASAERVLARETKLSGIYLEQLGTFGSVTRDPRMRVVSTAYLALLNKNLLPQQALAPLAAWFEIKVEENDNVLSITLQKEAITLHCQLRKRLLPKTKDQYQYEIIHSDLAFDHALLIAKGLERLKNKIKYTDLAFELLPETFSLNELQQVYQIILNQKLFTPAFRRMIEPKVTKTATKITGKGHRPAVLYRYKSE